jgi:hypothetical protein
MAEHPHERRLRRSDDPITALHYQLAHARHAARLDAVVLVDEAGSLVAGAGAWPVCEELAAFAPLLAQEDLRLDGSQTARRLQALRQEVRCKTLCWNGSEVLLAAKLASPEDFEEALWKAASGCLRILGETRALSAA